MNRTRTLVAIVALPGLLALILPFAEGISPLGVVLKPSDIFYAPLLRLAGPFFLAVVIALWMLRRLFVDRMSAVEVVLAYLLSSLSMLSTLMFIFKIDRNHIEIGILLSLGAAWIAALLNVLFLVHNIREHRNADDVAEAFLLAGYLPTALFCLIEFSPLLQKHFFIIHEESGALAVALACAAYITRIVPLFRRSGEEVAAMVQK